MCGKSTTNSTQHNGSNACSPEWPAGTVVTAVSNNTGQMENNTPKQSPEQPIINGQLNNEQRIVTMGTVTNTNVPYHQQNNRQTQSTAIIQASPVTNNTSERLPIKYRNRSTMYSNQHQLMEYTTIER